MHDSLRLSAVGLTLVAGWAGSCLAQGGPEYRLSGFGTVAAVQVDQPGVEFIQAGQTSGAGKSATFKTDSRLGGQLDVKFNPTFSATAQLLAKHGGDGSDRPRVEWAFGKAKLGGGFTLRAGRMGAPFFAVSDFREVGFANHWLRTPSDVYGQVFLRSFDGADLNFAGDVAGVPVTAQLIVGGTTATNARNKVDYKSQVGLNLTAEVVDGVTLRAGTIEGKLTIHSNDLRQLAGALAATPFASVGQPIDCNKHKTSFSGVGVSVERGNWVGSSEYTMLKSACVLPDTRGWHVMGGYRFGSVLPYIVASKLKRSNANVVNTIPSGVDPMLDFLSATVDGVVASFDSSQSTTAVGIRWDAWKNIAVKGQIERIDTEGRYGLFRPVGPAPTKPVQVLSLAVDFIF